MHLHVFSTHWHAYHVHTYYCTSIQRAVLTNGAALTVPDFPLLFKRICHAKRVLRIGEARHCVAITCCRTGYSSRVIRERTRLREHVLVRSGSAFTILHVAVFFFFFTFFTQPSDA